MIFLVGRLILEKQEDGFNYKAESRIVKVTKIGGNPYHDIIQKKS